MAGSFCEKYMRKMQIMMAVQPFSMIFSPAVGGSQKVAKVSSTITVGKERKAAVSFVARAQAHVSK
jgi:hypothetical protein